MIDEWTIYEQCQQRQFWEEQFDKTAASIERHLRGKMEQEQELKGLTEDDLMPFGDDEKAQPPLGDRA